jgi:hypothetical protein
MSKNPMLAKKSKNNSKRYTKKVVKGLAHVNAIPGLVSNAGKVAQDGAAFPTPPVRKPPKSIVRDVDKDLKLEGWLGNKG